MEVVIFDQWVGGYAAFAICSEGLRVVSADGLVSLIDDGFVETSEEAFEPKAGVKQ